LLALPIVVVLDEAYVEFAGIERSRLRWVPLRDNLIVLRTFSKWAGLAGLRVGYGAFPSALMPHLWKIKQPYNVSVAASAAAIAALQDLDHLEQCVARITAERERLMRLLVDVPYLRCYPSVANFVLCRVAGRDAHQLKLALEQEGICRVAGRDAHQLKLALEQEGILVRYFEKPGLSNHIRISVGQPGHTDALVAALRRL
jgi:histidinol-phosphate aminotransferase